MEAVSIRVLEFFQKAEKKRDINGNDTGEVELTDWVRYAPPGQLDRAVIEDKVSRLARVGYNAVDNPAFAAARARWDFIKPLYENWKAGNELPVTGTPLAAANFIRVEQAEEMKRKGIRTLEELLEMSEGACDKLNIVGMREIRAQARRFLEAQDNNRFAASMKARDEEIANLRIQLEDMREMFIRQKDADNRRDDYVAAGSGNVVTGGSHHISTSVTQWEGPPEEPEKPAYQPAPKAPRSKKSLFKKK